MNALYKDWKFKNIGHGFCNSQHYYIIALNQRPKSRSNTKDLCIKSLKNCQSTGNISFYLIMNWKGNFFPNIK